MSLKNVRYTRLETEESEGEEDESPPKHVIEPPYIKGSRWNHIDNLDEFFERVYEYQQKNGLATIVLGDVLELIQFLFIVIFTTFVVTCLRFDNLWADTIQYIEKNDTKERDVAFHDIFDFSQFEQISGIVVLFLLMAFSFWIHRLLRAIVRFYRFYGMRNFYIEALHISSADLRNTSWSDVVTRLKQAQHEYKMNIQKQELSELDIYHRILRFKNYLVAMVNKEVIQCRFQLPLYGEKVFFTHGLKFNYELILFWPSLNAPFKNSFYLGEEYKSASQKYQLVQNLRFRISLLAFLNLVFCPAIFLYQLIYSFFSYTELLKNQPGVFGRRRWSLYGHWYMRDFNELEHEFELRRNRAYKHSVKYMDLFPNPLLTMLAKNLAFIAGSLFAVLVVLTIIQEDLLTAHNILKILTILGLTVTICRIFIPSENQVWQPAKLMKQILGEIHYMPNHWKLRPHSMQVYREFTHIFQFTMMYVVDELLSPLITPFILYFWLRPKASNIVDFLRNFTIDVSGVGDICSFAEMNVRKHGNPKWLSEGLSTANQYEQAELGKTEISLMHFSRKNPDWKPREDGMNFMNKLKESVDTMHQSHVPTTSFHDGSWRPYPQESANYESSVTYLPPPATAEDSILPSLHQPPLGGQEFHQSSTMTSYRLPPVCSSDAMQWSIWSAQPDQSFRTTGSGDVTMVSYVGVAAGGDSMRMLSSTLDTLQIHQLHDLQQHGSTSGPPSFNFSSANTQTLGEQFPLSSNPLPAPSTENKEWNFPFLHSKEEEVGETSKLTDKPSGDLKEPLLQHPTAPAMDTEHAQLSLSNPATGIQGSSRSEDSDLEEPSIGAYQPFANVSGDHTVVDLHEQRR